MSSSSLKDLSKEINGALHSGHLELPTSLRNLLHDCLEKYPSPDEEYSPKLHDELLLIYNTLVVSSPARLMPFLSILFILKPTLTGAGRLIQWWEKLRDNVMDNLKEKGLVKEVRAILLRLLVWDEDESSSTNDSVQEDRRLTAYAIAENLVDIWITKHRSNLEYPDRYTQFVEHQVQQILFVFGRKRPKEFLVAVNGFFVNKESRILALTLLCEYIGQQPPHLHQMLQIPLFENLLKCLQIDTSTRVISLAMTALVMFLPHIPSSLVSHLPALFNIYSRMLFWDRERRASETIVALPDGDSDSSEDTEKGTTQDEAWAKMSYLLESDDETVPELLHYFTFLYGLYPINFMSYIRKPQKYLRHANFPGADDLDIEPSEIRQRSEPFRQVHLLHPNFFHLTIESELTDTNRWMHSQAPDVVAECMGLFTDGGDIQKHGSRTRGPTKKLNLDVSDEAEERLLNLQNRHSSWRYTHSTATASPDDTLPTQLQRSISHPNQTITPIGDSPTLPATASDGPAIPPQVLSPASSTNLADLLNSQRSVINKSATSLSLSNIHEQSIDEFLSFRARGVADLSGPEVAAFVDPAVKIAYLHREIQLLRNDLNFEQFLKTQHLSHIGQLRQKQLREARVEAETQNLINSNRQLRAKLEESKRINLQTRKETEKSRSHARKWETDLSNKLRALKEDQRKWKVEKVELQRDLENSRSEGLLLRQLVVKSERKELNARQRLMTFDGSSEELSHLRSENHRLNIALIRHETEERTSLRVKESEERAIQEAALSRSLLKAKTRELLLAKDAFEKELLLAHSIQDDAQSISKLKESVATYDSIITSARNRTMEIQKAYNRLRTKYNDVLQENMLLKGEAIYDDDFEVPPQSKPPGVRSPTSRLSARHSKGISNEWDPSNLIASSADSAPPALDTSNRVTAAGSSAKSPISPSGVGGTGHFIGTEPFLNLARRPSSKEKERESDAAAKIKPQSEVRIYGRGGVQNIGKKDKPKEGGKDTGGKDGDVRDGKKEKKGIGIRGIRGFV